MKRAPRSAVTCADFARGHSGAAGHRLERGQRAGRHRRNDLEIVTTGQHRVDRGRIGVHRGPRGLRQRNFARSRPSRRRPTREAACRDRRRARPKRPSRRWRSGGPPRPRRCAAAARDSARRDAAACRRRASSVSLRLRSVRSFSPSAASPMVPVTTIRSPARAPERLTMVPLRHGAERRDRDRHRPRRQHGVAAEQRTAGTPRRRAEPARKTLEPRAAAILRQRQRQQKARGLRALGREVRQVHAAAPCGRRRRADRRKRNARRRRWRPRSAPVRDRRAARAAPRRRPAPARRDAARSA